MEDLESNGQMGVPTQESTSIPAVEASDARKTDGDAEHLVLRTERTREALWQTNGGERRIV